MEEVKSNIFSILKTLAIAVVGLIIGYFLSNSFPLFANSALITGLLFAGLPFGWSAVHSFFAAFNAFGAIGAVFNLIVTFLCSILSGWAIMLFRFAKDIVGLVIAIRALAKVK